MVATYNSKLIIYSVLCIFTVAGYLALRGNNWQSSAEFHSILESISTMLALIVGVLAIVRFYSKASNIYLIIGSGFIGTAFLDGFHSIVTSAFFSSKMPSDLPSLVPWSWLASRILLSLILCLAWIGSLQEKQHGKDGLFSPISIYLSLMTFTLVSFAFFVLVLPPRMYYPEFFFHRPEEFVPAFLFLIAIFGFLSKGDWRHDQFEHWLLISTLLGFLGQALFMSSSGQLFDFEFDLAHIVKLGSYICVLIGLIISMYTIFQQVQGSEIQIEAILTTVNDAIITIDEKGIVQSFNPMAEQTFGYSAEAVIGQNVKLIMPVSDSTNHDQYISNYLQTRQAKIIGLGREVVGRHKDGNEIPIELAITETILEGRRIFVGSCRDITERNQAAQQIRDRTKDLEQLNTELNSFAYSVSHDLRAPLRSMDGFSQALLEDYGEILEQDAKEYLNRITRASRRMGHMIDDILALSRATSLERRIEDVDLSSLAQELTSELNANSKNRDVNIKIASNLQVKGDSRSLRIILGNLLENAWKFTKNKQSPYIEFGRYEDGGKTVYFVRDDGVGFDMTYKDKLFGIFQRLHSSSEFEGTGVGLAIASRLVSHHGGRIWGEGKVNKGATFSFTLNDRSITGVW